MWPDQVSNPGPLALESDALSTEQCSLAANRKFHDDYPYTVK